jgi:hypothetical protein
MYFRINFTAIWYFGSSFSAISARIGYLRGNFIDYTGVSLPEQGVVIRGYVLYIYVCLKQHKRYDMKSACKMLALTLIYVAISFETGVHCNGELPTAHRISWSCK